MNIFTLFSIFVLCYFKGIEGLIWPCNSTEDCNKIIEDTTCSPYGNCRCSPGYVFAANLTTCIPASFYGKPCEESVQCSHMPSGSKCNKGVCECEDGYTYVRGRCRLLNGLYGQCNEDVDCFFGYDRESVICRNNTCCCADGYYQRYDNICRRKSMAAGDPCIVDEDCDSKQNLKCEDRKCEPRRASREIAIQTSLEDSYLNNRSRKVQRIKHDEQIELQTISSDTESNSKKFGSECSKNREPCDGLDHSLCVEGICYCKLGYYPENGVCMAELGEYAANEDLCENVYDPKTKKCKCEPNYYQEKTLRTCIKPAVGLDKGCTHQSQCSPFGAAYCSTEKPKLCKCYSYAIKDEQRQICLTKKEGLGGYCDRHKPCNTLHSICSNENTCVCEEQYKSNGTNCLPGLGGECNNDDECSLENSECLNSSRKRTSSMCQCKKGFVHFEDTCIKEATEVGDDCVHSDQCKPLLGNLGECINKKCGCDEEHHLSYGKCEQKTALGEPCTKSSECFVENAPKAVECKNSVCRCHLNFSTDVEKQICVIPSRKNTSNRPSPLKVITLLLIGSAFLVTSAALKQAYY